MSVRKITLTSPAVRRLEGGDTLALIKGLFFNENTIATATIDILTHIYNWKTEKPIN